MSIEQQLREAGADHVLRRPLADVLARGEHLRRRRARRTTLGVAAAVACAVAGGSLVIEPGTSPLVTSAVASFSGPRTNLSAAELAELNAACLATQEGVAGLPKDAVPVAAEERSGRYLAYYRHGTANGACSARAGADDRIRVMGMGSGTTAAPLAGDQALALVILGYADPGAGTGVDGLHAVAQISEAVRRVTLRVGGATYEGSLAAGAVFFWVTDRGFTEEQAGAAVLTAYDGEGRVIGRG